MKTRALLGAAFLLVACDVAPSATSAALETTRRGVWREVGRSALSPDDHVRLVSHEESGKVWLVSSRPSLGAWSWDGTSFTAIDETSSRFYKQGAAYDSSRKVVVVFGGQEADHTTADTSSTTWLIDEDGVREVMQRGGPSARGGAALAYDAARDRVVLVGGTRQSSGAGLTDTWLFDGTTWTEAEPATPAPAVSAAGIAYDATRERVVIVKPVTDQRGETWEWDGNTWMQIATEGLPYAYQYSLTWDPDRQRVLGVVEGELWQYDGASWSRLDSDAADPSRRNGAIAYDATRDRVVFYSGGSTLWEHDGARWIAVEQPAPIARHNASTTFDVDRGRLLVTGGSGGQGNLQATWEWDGRAWTKGPDAPATTYDVGFAYDPMRRRAIIVLDGHTWAYDGASYVDLGATDVPARALAYDAARDRIVAHDGEDTATFDGSRWTKLTTAAPTGVRDTAMAYDAQRERLVRFGGYTDGSGSSEIDETWEYDGTAWTKATPTASPSRRGGHAQTYDAERGVVLLFGGYEHRETWEYDGTTWTQRVTENAPTGSFGNGMVYDPAAKRPLFYASDGRIWEFFPVGDTCMGDEDCASGVCADGVCCDHACPDPCYVCSTASGGSKDGICEPVRDAGMECRDEDGGVVPWGRPDGGTGDDDDDDDDDGGCCSVAGAGRDGRGALLAIALLGLTIWHRRRSRGAR